MKTVHNRIAVSLLPLALLSGRLLGQGRWQEIHAFESRAGAVMAYDANAGRSLCLGGFFHGWVQFSDNLWEWQGTAWQARQVATRPRGRMGSGLAYSQQQRGLLLYGGYTLDQQAPFAGKRFINDTWLWDGRQWTQLKPKSSPTPGRRFFSMAFDPGRKRMVIFGGDISLMAGRPIDETWEYDGQTWVQIFPKNKPSKRMGAAMAYNPNTAKILLFGGYDQLGQTQGDTWEWDGNDWTRLAGPVTGLGTRGASTMLAIPWKKAVYLIGGTEGAWGRYVFKTDIWKWTGKTWTPVPNSKAPIPEMFNGAVADPKLKRILVIGGQAVKKLHSRKNSTWSWDGATWTKVGQGAQQESNSHRASYALDPKHDQIMALVPPSLGSHPSIPWRHGCSLHPASGCNSNPRIRHRDTKTPSD